MNCNIFYNFIDLNLLGLNCKVYLYYWFFIVKFIYFDIVVLNNEMNLLRFKIIEIYLYGYIKKNVVYLINFN